MAKRIALVDDDQNIITSVSLLLESEGFEVDTYSDGEQALIGLRRRPADLGVRCNYFCYRISCKYICRCCPWSSYDCISGNI